VWQYTSSGSIDGISGRVDLNRFKGSFRKIAAG
jgi:GH25 family lysozyme M1 (1,4-beta-N-acetylmuramidase)